MLEFAVLRVVVLAMIINMNSMYLNVLQYSGKIHAAVPNAYGVCIAHFIAIPLWILYEMNTSPVISAPLTLKTAQHAFAVLLHFILFPQSSSQSYESSRS